MQASYTKRKLEKIYIQIDKLALKGKDYVYQYYELVDDIISKGNYGDFEQCLQYYYQIEITHYNNIPDVKKKTWPEILFRTNNSFSRKLKILYDSKEVYQTGLEVYSMSDTTLGLSMSSPLSSTYSIVSTTQSFTPSISNGFVYFNIDDIHLYQIEICRSIWESTIPININTLQLIQSGTYSYLPEDSYQTQIPLTHGSTYLVRTKSRDPFVELNYRLDITKNTYLGTIQEYDAYGQDTKHYYQNQEFAKLTGTKKTFLEVTKSSGGTGSMTYSVAIDYSKKEDQNLIDRYSLAIDFLLGQNSYIEDDYIEIGYFV